MGVFKYSELWLIGHVALKDYCVLEHSKYFLASCGQVNTVFELKSMLTILVVPSEYGSRNNLRRVRQSNVCNLRNKILVF